MKFNIEEKLRDLPQYRCLSSSGQVHSSLCTRLISTPVGCTLTSQQLKWQMPLPPESSRLTVSIIHFDTAPPVACNPKGSVSNIPSYARLWRLSPALKHRRSKLHNPRIFYWRLPRVVIPEASTRSRQCHDVLVLWIFRYRVMYMRR